MFHNEGETAVAKAAAKFNSLYCLSSLSTTTIEEISTILPPEHPKLFQIYVWKDRDLLKDVLDTAKKGNFQSMALTVDLAWYGNRERDIRNGFSVPPNYSARQCWEAVKRPAWTWDFLSNPEYNYALVNKHVPAASLASFINQQISPRFNWEDARWLCDQWTGPRAIKVSWKCLFNPYRH